MKRLALILILLLLVAVIAYRFVTLRKVEPTMTIRDIQAREGYPVEVAQAAVMPFQLSARYIGTVVGGEQASVVAEIGEYIKSVAVKEGQWVDKDQVICELADDNPTARYQTAKLALANAELELTRMHKLHEQGAVSKQQLDMVTLQRDVARENLKTGEKLLSLCAPIAGRVTELTAEVGYFAAPGLPLAKIVSNDRLRGDVKIPSGDRKLINSGASATIQADGNSVAGKVSRVALSADPKERTFTAWVDFNEPTQDFAFSPGLLVDVSINVRDVPDAVVVHPDALIRAGEHWRVYVVDGKHAKLRDVEVGGRKSDAAWISSGLNQGETVVVSGANLLFDGAPVRIITRN